MILQKRVISAILIEKIVRTKKSKWNKFGYAHAAENSPVNKVNVNTNGMDMRQL